MILAIDAETSGLPSKGMQIDNPQYPWACQIGCALFGFDGHDRAIFGSRIRAPEGRKISEGAAKVHGITSRDAARTGVPEIIALGVVCAYAAEARYIVGFNLNFDRSIIEAALIRLGKDTRKLMRPGLEAIDLMKPSASACKLTGMADDGGYKWPRLSEALALIRNERPCHGHHDALKDALSAKRLFLSLHHRGYFDIAGAA